ncbi:hypothetical protein BP6252_01975 [Coleophoma cylindrospora]|uniref:Uncharacterized protein n=1 Tax=Coleophoma cylindrospora TaxID=1849047 RepID=A0A3D8SDH2_9HELO|nr:hypothetical protein BP6252_01975 [Coleophoma cylindrospora]
MAVATLSPAQAHALFDILTHYEVYAEIKDLAKPETIQNFGYPFSGQNPGEASAPIQQIMVNKVLMQQPGISSLMPSFWQGRVDLLLSKLAEAGLSDSYEKGGMGIRKTIATAAAVIVESVARGMLGGLPRKQTPMPDHSYNLSSAEDIHSAFDDLAQGVVYGDALDMIIRDLRRSDKLEDQSQLYQASVEYAVIIIASFLHHIFVLSPDGPYLATLLANVHKIAPYMAIKQTLRMGNAATMINGMMKLMLTKLSFTAMTNWVGLSKNENEGMNLLQRIISTVLAYDNMEFKSAASNIEKSKDAPSKEHLKAIKAHLQQSREERNRATDRSIQESKSIVTVIFESQDPPLSTELSAAQHTEALNYYSALLSIRDREKLVDVSCRLVPDILTEAIREVVAAYEPIIRSVHEGVDLSAVVGDLQLFMDDLIKISKPNPKAKGTQQPPSVEEYVELCRKHMTFFIRIGHNWVNNCPQVVESFVTWGKEVLQEFRVPEHDIAASDSRQTPSTSASFAAGTMTNNLSALFDSLAPNDQIEVAKALDAHSAYLASLERVSISKTQSILNSGTTAYGPGMYLARWHGLLDEALITPATSLGPLRYGSDVKLKDSKILTKSGWDLAQVSTDLTDSMPVQPDVTAVQTALGGKFKALMQREAIY